MVDVREKLSELGEQWGAVMTDPDTAFTLVKQVTGIGIGISISSVSFSLTVIFVQQGRTAPVFVALALFWGGYLLAHYTATGKVIHQAGSHTALPTDRRKAVLAVLGVTLLLAGITAVPLPAASGDIATTSAAVLVAATGYLMAHYGFTGDLL